MDANGELPPNGQFSYDPSTNTVVQTSPWSALSRILPFVEQEGLYHVIDFTTGYSTQPNVSSKRIGTYICPDERNAIGSGTDPVYGNKNFTLNYAANLGTWSVLTDKAGSMKGTDGAFSPDHAFNAKDFRDGLSNTLAFSEVKSYTTRVTATPNTATYSPAPTPPA